MNDKIKRLAKNLSDLIPEQEELQATYDLLTQLMNKQKDYFIHKPPEEVIKLLFYIWSYHKTHSFELGDEMLNKLGFALLFYTEGEQHKEYCDDCGGNGDVPCDVCDGNGRTECDTCDGSGEEQCQECDGSGEIEGDGEMVKCEECDGEGILTCSDCAGDGTKECDNCNYGNQTCDTCDGNGEVETDDLNYNEYFIVTWNKMIKDRCEYTQEDTDITMSEYDFDKLRDRFVVLHFDPDRFAEFKDFVQENEVYCPYYNDNPKMEFTSDMKLKFIKGNISAYLK
jgi:hypothetical protein